MFFYLYIVSTYFFNRDAEDDEASESDSPYTSDLNSDESLPGPKGNITEKNVYKSKDEADCNERTLNFKTRNNRKLKRFLYEILVYNLFNICYCRM